MAVRLKKRILVTPASNILAHAGRCVLLATELAQRGHEIILAGSPRYLQDPQVTADSFHYRPLPDFEASEGLTLLRTLHRRPGHRLLQEHIQAELDLIDQIAPDAVIIDFRLTMYLSAMIRGVPRISLLGGRWLPSRAAYPYRAFRTYPHYRLIKRLVGRAGTDWLVPQLLKVVLWYKMAPYRTLMKQLGLPVKTHLWDLLEGELNLVLDSERLAPLNELPAHFVRVGPLYWSPSGPLPEWFEDVASDRPLVYVTMGSTGHPALFPLLIALFADRAFNVILTTGGQVSIEEKDLPTNIRVARFLPGGAVMQRADVVICHGGAGSVYQAISAGRPVIAIATHFEQELLGQQIEAAGAGILLSLHEVLAEPTLVMQSVKHILDNRDHYTSCMKVLRDSHARYDPVRSAADAIESFLGVGSEELARVGVRLVGG
ncbi:MAG TPA: nucleotide disphospho-sugar-binding domain-containing protein [Blastocatellia bacterium]|nr:nucleotide disphospho-sugar-binding domain-containing protein [Blastocatellia bacterium]